MGSHARLPASAAHRWTACPASAYMDESGDRRGSRYAAEGTAAHALAELCLTHGDDPREYFGHSIVVGPGGETRCVMTSTDQPVHGGDDWLFEVDPDMVDAVALFIQATQDALITMEPGGTEYIEERVSPGHPHLGGTLDWAYVSGDRAVVIDFKYGRGVVVEVHDNPQQMIYALGLLARHPEVKEVDSYIVQPRARHADGPIRVATYTADELAKFYGWLLERVDAADKPGAPRVAGEHCRFCPDLAACPAARKMAQDAAVDDFVGGADGDAIAEGLASVPAVEAWVKAVRKEALSRLMNERDVPGWKLVHGRATRAWAAVETEVLKIARKAGLLKAECLTAPKLLSPYGLEQAAVKGGGLSSREAKDHFSTLWEAVPGGPTLAPEDDPREEFRRSPEDDFDVV